MQARLFKSLKLWSFYVDLEESLGTVESTKAVYDKILELRIANAQIIVNYAGFLEENKYFEECFKVYERGVELFTFPVSFEIWNIYLSKFVKRYVGSFLHTFFAQILIFCSGWLKTRKSARFVRAGSREVPTEVVQTYISVVCSTRRGTRSSEAGDDHLRSCYSGCGERG